MRNRDVVSPSGTPSWTLLLAAANPEAPNPQTEPDAMVLAIARAFHWQKQIVSHQFASVQAHADREGVDNAFVYRQLRLKTLQLGFTGSAISAFPEPRSIKSASDDNNQAL
jgi:hypothetical protein